MKPNGDQIKRASKDVAWEYATMLAASLEMTNGHGSPINHLIQEAFLAHVRNLAEFFHKGIEGFEKAQVPPERVRNNIYAVDFCLSVAWKPETFGKDSKLVNAINKTLAHMTYSRDRASKDHDHFDGHLHLHGTVKLMRQTWGAFLRSVDPRFLRPENPEDIHYWFGDHTRNWEVSIPSRRGERLEFGAVENQFETRVNKLARNNPEYWVLNQTPDGPV